MNGTAPAISGSKSTSLSVSVESVIPYPIILTGRGGSGTRMLSTLSQSGNLFIGNELNESGDSLEWSELLYEISIRKLEASEKNQDTDTDKLNRRLQRHAIDYLSIGNWQVSQHWGWKLPESMLVIPELTTAFNQSKLIHLVRHPVSSSIRRTHKTSRTGSPIGRAVLKAAYKRAGRDVNEIEHDDDYLRNALTWKYQVEEVSNYAKHALPDNRYWEVKYEDICAHPQRIRKQLLNFLDIKDSDVNDTVNSVEIDSSRNNALSFSDPRAEEVWELCADVATKLGYHSTGVNDELG